MSAQHRSGKKLFDIVIEPSLVCGFYLIIKHGDEGLSTQIKALRVLAIMTDFRGDASSMRQILSLVIPKCKPGTELYYEFLQPTYANVITMEFVSNYGGVELCIPQIRICKNDFQREQQ